MNDEKITQMAKELIEEFAETVPPRIYGQLMERDWVAAKRCAILCCQKIIAACEFNYVESYNTDWWNKVIEEIKTNQ
jgi:hypothetical protein